MFFAILFSLIAVILIAWFLAYLFIGILSRPKVISSDPDIRKLISSTPFYPSILSATPLSAINGIMPTYFSLTRKKMPYKTLRETVRAADGGTFGLDWFDRGDLSKIPSPSTVPPPSLFSDPKTPICVVVHGVNGGSGEPPVRSFCIRATKLNFRVVCFTMRGCAGLPLTTCMGYSGALTGDFHQALSTVAARYPDAPICIVGYSLGANMVGKYLGEQKSAIRPERPQSHWPAAIPPQVRGAVCIGTPFNFVISVTGMKPAYDKNILRGLKFYFNKHKAVLSQRCEPRLIENATKCIEFDDNITGPLQGYKSGMHYYQDAGCARYIDGIRTPTLFLSARTDPISISQALPLDAAIRANPALSLVVTRAGGHLGWFRLCGGRTWDEDIAIAAVTKWLQPQN